MSQTVTITETEEERLTRHAVRVSLASSKEEKRSRCWEAVHDVLWGNEGAQHMHLKIAIVVGLEGVFLMGVVLDLLTGGALKSHGIHPRDFPLGLLGVFFAPFLHRNVFHLLVNAVPFAVLSMLVLLRRSGIATYFLLTIMTTMVSGMLVWVLGASGTNHIGASGLIFAYFGYLVTNGIVKKSIRDFLIALVVFLMYSSIFWGVLPIDEKVSWESHLFGLCCGVLFGMIDSQLTGGAAGLPASKSVAAMDDEMDSDDERKGLLA